LSRPRLGPPIWVTFVSYRRLSAEGASTAPKARVHSAARHHLPSSVVSCRSVEERGRCKAPPHTSRGVGPLLSQATQMRLPHTSALPGGRSAFTRGVEHLLAEVAQSRNILIRPPSPVGRSRRIQLPKLVSPVRWVPHPTANSGQNFAKSELSKPACDPPNLRRQATHRHGRRACNHPSPLSPSPVVFGTAPVVFGDRKVGTVSADTGFRNGRSQCFATKLRPTTASANSRPLLLRPQ
jgi:hypothetical protein